MTVDQMTVEQRQKVQHAIQALIDVESALHHGSAGGNAKPHLAEVQAKLHAARMSLLELNAPEYN